MFEVTDNLTKLMGNHTFKVGMQYRRTTQWGYNEAGSGGGIYPNVTLGTTLGNAVPATIGPNGSTVISSANRQQFDNLYNDVLGRMNQVVQVYFSDLQTWQPAGTPRERNFRFQEQGLLLPGRL